MNYKTKLYIRQKEEAWKKMCVHSEVEDISLPDANSDQIIDIEVCADCGYKLN